MRYFAFCLLLFLAACGGGNAADNVSETEKYIPDFSTAEGATEAFIRAVETENYGLLGLCLQEDEREAVLARFRKNFEESHKQGLTWKLEHMPESEMYEDKEARAAIKYTSFKDGKPTGDVVGQWYVFIKTADGSWKFSDAARLRWLRHLEERARPPANQPANAPD